MNLDRLNRLITVLENVRDTEKPLYMGAWIDEVANINPEEVAGVIEPCGTACCALGYGALDSVLQADGLRLVHKVRGNSYSDGHIETEILTLKDFNTAPHDEGFFSPVYDGMSDMGAGKAFFGIDYEASCYLFDPEQYNEFHGDEAISPDTVIARVRAVIAAQGERPFITEEEES